MEDDEVVVANVSSKVVLTVVVVVVEGDEVDEVEFSAARIDARTVRWRG